MMTRKKKWWCGTNYKNLHGWVELAQCTCMRRPLYILMCTCNYMHLYTVDVIYNLSVCCYACSKEEEEWANIIGDVLFEEWVRNVCIPCTCICIPNDPHQFHLQKQYTFHSYALHHYCILQAHTLESLDHLNAPIQSHRLMCTWCQLSYDWYLAMWADSQ